MEGEKLKTGHPDTICLTKTGKHMTVGRSDSETVTLSDWQKVRHQTAESQDEACARWWVPTKHPGLTVYGVAQELLQTGNLSDRVAGYHSIH